MNFWFSAFSLPRGCLKASEKLCSRFLWSGDIGKRPLVKVCWKDICLPKAEGGLGLRNFLIWNRVLNLRLVWLIFTNSGSLWVAWIREHKLKRACFFFNGIRSCDSWIWKYILSLRPLAKILLSCKVRDGESAGELGSLRPSPSHYSIFYSNME